MFFFPYGTDAPLYHRPVITVLMIVLNVYVFLALLAYPDRAEPLMLAVGDGLHPSQWLTAGFVHGGFGHLLGNMFALWVFGLIVEGKLGWWKMFVLFVGMSCAENAIEQMATLSSPPCHCLGASGVIFGLMAMSLIWAPANKVHCLWVVVVFIIVRFGTWEVSVAFFVGLLLLLQVVVAIFTGLTLSSEMLHLTGAALGFAVAVAMLKLRLVDCEQWDAFSLWAGRHESRRAGPLENARLLVQAELKGPKHHSQQEIHEQARRDDMLKKIRLLLREGQPAIAAKVHERMQQEFPADWHLPEQGLLAIIRGLREKKQWAEAIPPMVEYLAQYPEKAALMRLELGRILVCLEYLSSDVL
jgi:membrane associated rhomboid family serine protease